MSNQSMMVLASKYRLKVPLNTKKGIYDVKGEKEFQGKKLVKRSFVEERNQHTNNEYWELHEEETTKLMEQREKNILLNAEKNREKNMPLEERIAKGLIAGSKATLPAEKKQPEIVSSGTIEEAVENKGDIPLEEQSLDQLKQYCDASGIKYHHAAKEAKLIETIKNHEK